MAIRSVSTTHSMGLSPGTQRNAECVQGGPMQRPANPPALWVSRAEPSQQGTREGGFLTERCTACLPAHGHPHRGGPSARDSRRASTGSLLSQADTDVPRYLLGPPSRFPGGGTRPVPHLWPPGAPQCSLAPFFPALCLQGDTPRHVHPVPLFGPQR